MKILKSFLLLFCLACNTESLYAQTPKFVEADLIKSYDKIFYWRSRAQDQTVNAYDSVKMANTQFGDLLKYYTAKYPSMINQNLAGIRKPGFSYFGAGDDKFRVYSWDTWLGKTERSYGNVFEYISGDKGHSELQIDTADNPCHLYSKVNTFTNNGKTYYLVVYNSFFITKRATQGIQVFTIENGKLKRDNKLIKTDDSIVGDLSYDYNYGTNDISDLLSRPTIHFNGYTNTIYIPVVINDFQVPGKFITYKFTGKYFEKVK